MIKKKGMIKTEVDHNRIKALELEIASLIRQNTDFADEISIWTKVLHQAGIDARHATDVCIALHNRISKLELEASKKKDWFLVRFFKWLKG